MLAVRFARTYPDRVTRLVLEDPVGLEDYRVQIPPQSIETLFRGEMENTDPQKIRAFYATYFARPDPAVYGPLADVQARVTLSGEYPRWARASARAYQMIYQQPVRYEFRMLSMPTLLVVGEADRTVVMRNFAPPEALKTMGNYPRLAADAARDIPDCKLLILKDTGHIPHVERADEFHRAVIDFCR
jgi:pimeloyl-ACP methyl ester carboxylesterase